MRLECLQHQKEADLPCHHSHFPIWQMSHGFYTVTPVAQHHLFGCHLLSSLIPSGSDTEPPDASNLVTSASYLLLWVQLTMFYKCFFFNTTLWWPLFFFSPLVCILNGVSPTDLVFGIAHQPYNPCMVFIASLFDILSSNRFLSHMYRSIFNWTPGLEYLGLLSQLHGRCR